MDKKLIAYLDKIKINYKVHRHKAVFSVAESRELKKEIPGMHCKTLFLKDENGKFYLIGMPAEKRLDSKTFKQEFGVKDIRFASAEELKKEIGLAPGSVSIFGAIYLKKGILVLDEEVWNSSVVGFHPNENTSTLELDHKNLERFYKSLECGKRVVKL